jgi:hypothetical protein
MPWRRLSILKQFHGTEVQIAGQLDSNDSQLLAKRPAHTGS